jgi:Icc protein
VSAGMASGRAAGDGRDGGFCIAHISDLHCGSPHFQPELLERAIDEINELRPDVTIVSGDLTTDGFKPEYEAARAYLERIRCDDIIVVPGNHDSRNVGYVHFEEMFGSRTRVLYKGGVTIVALDSSEPDLDHGQIGRNRYRSIEEAFSHQADLRILVLHHHLLPVPGTGRERNVVYDAGDLLEVLLRSGCHLVLSGHKHVPYAWKLENLLVVTAGTVSSLRLRGHTRPCYNIIEVGERVAIFRKYPFDNREPIVEFAPGTDEYEKSIALRGITD